ncbi:MAG: hypothetical protein Ct9H300mP16_13880 [Pseudomonadota bacterium]|nr:MAG: hypothetical protein Ct9H300mP16_13880 [Pseudomonadota bacterium]
MSWSQTVGVFWLPWARFLRSCSAGVWGSRGEGQAPDGSRAGLYMEGFNDPAVEQILATTLKAASNLEQALELQAVRSAGPNCSSP